MSMMDAAVALSVEADSRLCELLADEAAELDVLGVQTDDPTTMTGRDLSPGRSRVTLYVDPEAQALVEAEFAAILGRYDVRSPISAVRIEPQDWNATWKAHFRALDIGRTLRIEPPWDRHPQGERKVLVVDPGMAFGTGSHETTRLAASAVEGWILAQAEKGVALADLTMLDVGTGSALLAMAAVRLGLGHAIGVDNDALAIDSARDNLALNDLQDAVELHVAEHPDALAGGTYPLVVANIISSVLLSLREGLVARTAIGGTLLLSGVLAREEPAFLAAFVDQRLELVRSEQLGEWMAFTLLRRA
ncbi:MAG: 50S ribosomal protein L11 methyltransferase [Deltaproteobacteria bacterium]|nr:50S ribosomal protein L11 methyltransferase [Deltaproteobacteria bacterium]